MENYQQEYETRILYFDTRLRFPEMNWINELTSKWEGSQMEYDKLIQPYKDLDEVAKIFKYESKPDSWGVTYSDYVDEEELKIRKIFAGTQNKENNRRIDAYRYLSSSF